MLAPDSKRQKHKTTTDVLFAYVSYLHGVYTYVPYDPVYLEVISRLMSSSVFIILMCDAPAVAGLADYNIIYSSNWFVDIKRSVAAG